MRTLRVLLAVAAAAVTFAGTCNEEAEVNVTYKQLAYFPTYRTPESDGSHGAGTGGMFVLYRITRIENTGAQAADFEWDSRKVVATLDSLSKEHLAAEQQLLGSKLLSKTTVGAGKTKTTGLGCFIMRVQSDNVVEDFGNHAGTSTKVDLIYEIDGDQPVHMRREAGNDTFSGTDPGDAQYVQSKCG